MTRKVFEVTTFSNSHPNVLRPNKGVGGVSGRAKLGHSPHE